MPLMSASSQLELNIDQNGSDESRDIENFEDCDFPASKEPNYDGRAHAHHMRTGQNAPQNSIPKFSQDVQLKTTHCHSHSLNRNTWQHTFHSTTHCQWLSKHRKHKIETQTTLSTDLPRQLQVLHLNNDLKRRQHYSNQQKQAH